MYTYTFTVSEKIEMQIAIRLQRKSTLNMITNLSETSFQDEEKEALCRKSIEDLQCKLSELDSILEKLRNGGIWHD